MKTLETIKSAFLYLIAAKRIIKTIGFIINVEIDRRKRLFTRAFIFYALGGGLLMGGILSMEYLLYLVTERFLNDPILSAAIVTFASLFAGVASLFIGSNLMARVTRIDWDGIIKTLK